MNKTKHDISQIFLVYMAVCGDGEKTALALDLDIAFVNELAASEGWADKVRRISVMSKSGTPGDWERAQNRALNFVQAHQTRRIIDGVIAHLASLTPLQVLDKVDNNGVHTVSARVLTDLAKALQTIHDVSYNALGDSPKERTDRGAGEGGDQTSANGIHAAMISALNATKASAVPSAETLVKEAVATIETLKSAAPSV